MTDRIGGNVSGGLALIPGVPTLAIDPDLALGAVAFTTLFVGVVAKWFVLSLPWAVCFALGAIVSLAGGSAADAPGG